MIALTRKQVAKLARKEPARLLTLKYASGQTWRLCAAIVAKEQESNPKPRPVVFLEGDSCPV